MTKEKILQDKITYSQSDQYSEINFVVGREDCYEAMDKYAKQECIAFMEAYQFGKIPFEKEPDEVEELYDLYFQSKGKVV